MNADTTSNRTNTDSTPNPTSESTLKSFYKSISKPTTIPTTIPVGSLIETLTAEPVPATAEGRVAVDVDGHPIQFFYDVPCFVSNAFNFAADAVDYWVGQYTGDVTADEAGHTTAAGPQGHRASLLNDLHLYQPSFAVHLSENANLTDALREVLDHTLVEVHGLAETDRGFYLAQLITRWHSGGTLDWARFRLANLLGTYFSMMPTAGSCLGVIAEEDQSTPMVVWSTEHGFFIDVVPAFLPLRRYVAEDVKRALALGRKRWGAEFGGVRYLPVGDIFEARFYRPDGKREALVERDLIGFSDTAPDMASNTASDMARDPAVSADLSTTLVAH